jgi:hypothetical protein
MAIYHLSLNTISRGKGQSAIASAAYRSGEKLHSERYGKDNFYSREVQPETFILKPEHAPEWTLDREKLWNAVEEIEKPVNARLAREINIALPIELSNEEQRDLTEKYVQKNFVDEGMVADVSIHRDDENNPHFHVMLTTRPFDENGEWGQKQKKVYVLDDDGNKMKTEKGNIKSKTIKLTDWDSTERLKIWRKSWADMTNDYLERKGLSERITEKSYAEQGVDKEPTIHEGYVARKMESQGKVSDRCEKNREIKKENYQKQANKKDDTFEKTSQKVIAPLKFEEKRELKEIAKELKVYVNYDNLIEKDRMVKNWKISVKADNVGKDSLENDSRISDIKRTEEAINRGKEILKDEGIRTFEKYYPKLAERKFSDYQKMSVGLETVEKKRVLNNDEIKNIFTDIQVKEYADLFKSVSSSKNVKPLSNYAQNFVKSSKQLDDFYEENNISIENISSLDEDKQSEFKELFKQKNRDYLIYNTLNKYHEENILSHYPTAHVEDLKANQKEALSKVISYYGNSLSYDKLADLADQEIVNKYSYNEQKYGVQLLYKIENETLADEDMLEIYSDYRKQEIYDTVSNEETKELFIYEVENNGILDTEIAKLFADDSYSAPNIFSTLAKNVDVYEDIMRAQRDNLMREQEDKRNRSKKKQQANSVKNKKNKNIKAPKI